MNLPLTSVLVQPNSHCLFIKGSLIKLGKGGYIYPTQWQNNHLTLLAIHVTLLYYFLSLNLKFIFNFKLLIIWSVIYNPIKTLFIFWDQLSLDIISDLPYRSPRILKYVEFLMINFIYIPYYKVYLDLTRFIIF